MGNLRTPESIQRIQKALYEKAKSEPKFVFYSLYDKIYREDILLEAYRRSIRNGGGPGMDGQTFTEIEWMGKEGWLSSLAGELRDRTYRPGPIKRVNIPKPNGKMRPLGIPNIKDRVVQTAVSMVLGSIYEADLADEQYAYRDGKNALDAVRRVQCLLNRDGHNKVVDADLSSYFDTIPHAKLMKELGRRTSDKGVLHLIKMWLIAPVEEVNKETGKIQRTTVNKDQRKGTPQGAPISPLLSNVYMSLFIKEWKKLGLDVLYKSEIVNYADDLVICCKKSPEAAMAKMRRIMSELGLTVNEEKTKIEILPKGKFDFLGYEFRRLYSWRLKKMYIGTRPNTKSVSSLMKEVHEHTAAKMGCKKTSTLVKGLNAVIKGWASYFSVGSVHRPYKTLSRYIIGRFRHWFGRKHKWKTKGYKRYPDEKLYKITGLINLQTLAPKYS
jgi:group II intron reverse transcriptase/maturase